jgi:hypothetical protein
MCARVTLVLCFLVAVTAFPQTTSRALARDPCEVTLEWVLVEYTEGNVGRDSWRWGVLGIVSGVSNGRRVVPDFGQPLAGLQPGASFNPRRVLLLDQRVGNKGDPLNVIIEAQASERDDPRDVDIGTTRFTGVFTCVGTGRVEFPVTVDVTDLGVQEEGVQARAKAKLTYEFVLTWGP